MVLDSNGDWTVGRERSRKDKRSRLRGATQSVGRVGDGRLGKMITEDFLSIEIHDDSALIGNVEIDRGDVQHSHKGVTNVHCRRGSDDCVGKGNEALP